ncbi:MAG: hypothetical protein N2512_08020, partial [Armatimonadetes bacterium]|nr:hypothetical protein [Armatimonadota bacterium]
LRSPRRLQVLLLALMLLYSVLFWLGLTAARSPLAPKLVCSGLARVGYIHLALTLIRAFPFLLTFLARHAPHPFKSG